MSIEILVNTLKQKKLKIATAESCTGGLLAKKVTDVNGASSVFEIGIVAYANRIKEQLLEVPEEVIINFGAVSGETAEYMAKGITKISGADIGVGITGIAGPEGGTIEKPVGLVYFSIYMRKEDKCVVEKLLLKGTRNEIREQTTEITIEKILRLVI